MTPRVHIKELELRVVHRGTPWLDREALARSGEQVRRVILADLEKLLGDALPEPEPARSIPRLGCC